MYECRHLLMSPSDGKKLQLHHQSFRESETMSYQKCKYVIINSILLYVQQWAIVDNHKGAAILWIMHQKCMSATEGTPATAGNRRTPAIADGLL